MKANPKASVIVCTRNRADSLAPALRSILASTYGDFELIVVDQSNDNDSHDVVGQLAGGPVPIVYLNDGTRGLSRARNAGIAQSKGRFVVFTDDDCEVREDWLALMVEALERDPEAGATFGSVIAAPFDARQGFIAGYIPPTRRRLRGRLGKLYDGGIGANMAFRRSALDAIGPFDEMLGAGGYFPSCEDGDQAYRILKAGYALWHVPEAAVIHHGMRDWQSGSKLTRQTFSAVAVAYMKHLRLGDPVALLLLIQQAMFGIGNLGASLLRRRRPFGVGRVLALVVGVRRSFELAVEPEPPLYARRTGA